MSRKFAWLVAFAWSATCLLSTIAAQNTATDTVKPYDPADLAIGKTAPDIEAEDVYGVPLKLSDYRGKVVVLDFWGDW